VPDTNAAAENSIRVPITVSDWGTMTVQSASSSAKYVLNLDDAHGSGTVNGTILVQGASGSPAYLKFLLAGGSAKTGIDNPSSTATNGQIVISTAGEFDIPSGGTGSFDVQLPVYLTSNSDCNVGDSSGGAAVNMHLNTGWSHAITMDGTAIMDFKPNANLSISGTWAGAGGLQMNGGIWLLDVASTTPTDYLTGGAIECAAGAIDFGDNSQTNGVTLYTQGDVTLDGGTINMYGQGPSTGSNDLWWMQSTGKLTFSSGTWNYTVLGTIQYPQFHYGDRVYTMIYGWNTAGTLNAVSYYPFSVTGWDEGEHAGWGTSSQGWSVDYDNPNGEYNPPPSPPPGPHIVGPGPSPVEPPASAPPPTEDQQEMSAAAPPAPLTPLQLYLNFWTTLEQEYLGLLQWYLATLGI
jgi:hypothetical protein